jgi:hypothetical protein
MLLTLFLALGFCFTVAVGLLSVLRDLLARDWSAAPESLTTPPAPPRRDPASPPPCAIPR